MIPDHPNQPSKSCSGMHAINGIREQYGTPPVEYNRALEEGAQAWADYLAEEMK